MTLLDYFNECSSGGWTTAGLDVQFKVKNRVLYFQCSHGKSDWRYNFKFAQSVYSKSDIKFKMHKGFKNLWLSVKPIIEKLEFDEIIGYSQGAALAIAAHENFCHRKGYEPKTITFGNPASIFMPSRKLRNRFTNVLNVTNPHDIVYYSTLILGYRHVGKKKVLKEVTMPRAKSFKEWLENLSGHSPYRYRKALRYEN